MSSTKDITPAQMRAEVTARGIIRVPVWSPDDFDRCVEQALALVRGDRATVVDISTRAVIG